MSERRLAIPGADGVRLAATEHVPDDLPADAPTVVLAHGWTLTGESWAPVVSALQDRHRVRVVTYDQRGHGASSPGSRRAPSVRDLGEDLATVLDATAPRGPLVLAGHSMGGMTLMAYAATHSPEFRDRVRGAVLVSTTAALTGRRPVRGEDVLMRLAARAPAVAPRRLLPAAMHRRTIFGEDPDPDAVAATARQIGGTSLPTLGRYFCAIRAHDEMASLAAFAHVPTHVVVGTRDRLTPVRWSRALHDGIPGSRLTIVPGKGHMLTYEATDVVTDALAELLDQPHRASA